MLRPLWKPGIFEGSIIKTSSAGNCRRHHIPGAATHRIPVLEYGVVGS